MSLALPKIESRYTVAANTDGVAIDGGAAAYVAAGDYYLSSPAPGGSVGLLAAFEAVLAAAVPQTEVRLDSTTGLVKITWGSGTHTIAWSSASFRDLLGFAGDLTPAAASFEATAQARRLWLPAQAASGLEGSYASMGRLKSDRITIVARDGTPYQRSGGNVWRVEKMTFRGLPRAKVHEADETTANQSFESFLQDGLLADGQMRVYRDRTDDASYLAGARPRDYVLGEGWELTPSRTVGNVDATWDLTLELTEANP
jgi:hypothetical protein